MSSARYPAAVSATFTATLKNDDGTAIPYDAGGTAEPRVTALTLSLVDGASGETVNSRSAQDVLNTNDVTVDGSGVLSWKIQPADLTVLAASADRATAEHVATFSWTYVDDDSATKYGRHEHRLRIRNASPLCNFDDVREQLAIEDEDQEFVEMLIDQVTARFEAETGRKFRRATVTEYHSPLDGQTIIRVKRYPIASVTTLSEDSAGDFQASDAIDADDWDAVTHAERGVVRMRFRSFYCGTGTVKIVYAGGYRDPAEVPFDLRMAAVRQVGFLYQRRRQLGESGVSMDGRNVQLYARDLLDDVRATLASHTHRSLA